MTDDEKCKGPGTLVLLSFQVGTAVGIGMILLAERKMQNENDATYGEGPLFV